MVPALIRRGWRGGGVQGGRRTQLQYLSRLIFMHHLMTAYVIVLLLLKLVHRSAHHDTGRGCCLQHLVLLMVRVRMRVVLMMVVVVVLVLRLLLLLLVMVMVRMGVCVRVMAVR